MIEIVVKLFNVTCELMCKEDVLNLMNKYINSLEQVVCKMEHVHMQLKNYVNIEDVILGTICDLTEMYHFFKYNISSGK